MMIALRILASSGTPPSLIEECELCGRTPRMWYGNRCPRCYLTFEDDDGDDPDLFPVIPITPKEPSLVG